MKILLYGFGKLGKIYFNKFLELSCDLFIVDPFAQPVAGFQIYPSFHLLPKEFFRLVVICTSTGQHVSCIANHLFSDSLIFCEKPVVFGVNETEALSALFLQDSSLKNRLFVSAPLRFSEPIQQMREAMHNLPYANTKGFFRFSHSTLRMRGANWKNSYIAQNVTHSSLAYDCIHEIDLAFWFFGPVSRIKCLSSTLGLIDGINMPQSCVLEITHNSCAQSLFYFDFVSHLKIREASVTADNIGCYLLEIGKSQILRITHQSNPADSCFAGLKCTPDMYNICQDDDLIEQQIDFIVNNLVLTESSLPLSFEVVAQKLLLGFDALQYSVKLLQSFDSFHTSPND